MAKCSLCGGVKLSEQVCAACGWGGNAGEVVSERATLSPARLRELADHVMGELSICHDHDDCIDTVVEFANTVRALAAAPAAVHLATYGEQGADDVPTACGQACSTWDKPLRYAWDRADATCLACLRAIPTCFRCGYPGKAAAPAATQERDVNSSVLLCQTCEKAPATRRLSHAFGWEDVCDNCWSANTAAAASASGASGGSTSADSTHPHRAGVGSLAMTSSAPPAGEAYRQCKHGHAHATPEGALACGMRPASVVLSSDVAAPAAGEGTDWASAHAQAKEFIDGLGGAWSDLNSDEFYAEITNELAAIILRAMRRHP